MKSTFRDVVISIGTRETNTHVVGTILHKEDLMSDLLKGRIPGVRSIKNEAIIQWSEREKQYTNLSDRDRIDTALSFLIQIKR
ncbi:hypothetical protein [Halalkalibacterium halodurans]|uniref:hypothetical protein n=1 Tax=Halalkalibacterium halodurans TaxID=86665 RepID=UPI001FB922E4|nr:hypothetical protein [Halalkalibacterium halodurans]